ncbi:MAG: galactose-1-phosphate uridylyltransferase [Streptosporangiales bacterium]|nr:galactose-1-phosphate uridylyltransferase [Streptosporangiales bacterium]
MITSSARLADGREIIYFDEKPGSGRAAVADTRDLGVTSTASELRLDPLLEEWTIVASHRQGRTFLPPADQCPLCPSRPGRPSEIPAPDYDVVVFENRFPSLAEDVPDVPGAVDGEAIFPRRPGRGRCEVLVFTSEHEGSFAALTPDRARTVIEAWADRTAALSALPEVEHVFPFENRGEEIGVTLHHPHGQIYAYPFVAPRVAAMVRAAWRHRERYGRNLFDDVVEAERRAGERIVVRGEHWTGFVPAAARWPYEVRLFPDRRVPDLAALDDAERDDLAVVYLELLRRFDGLFDTRTPYIAAWHQAPVHEAREEFGLHLQLFTVRRAAGKLKYLAGSESGMAVWINDITPESAAAQLRSIDV